MNALGRGLSITKTVLEYFVLSRLNRHRNQSLGVRLREACERLGMVFIKIGQILSTRYDLLQRSDCEELQKLLDDVPSMSDSEITAAFLSDFAAPPEQLFHEFSRAPIASASISQVHRATLKDGHPVAVKIRRPGIERTITSDLKVFRWFARVARIISPTLRRIDVLEALRQLEQWLWLEVDFRHEVANLVMAKEFYRENAELAGGHAAALVFPTPYPEFCSKQVITMDFLEGVPAKDFREVIGNPEYDPRASLESLVRSVLRVWMTGDSLIFHGDPHPSNILLMKHGQVGLLDLGLLSRFNFKDLRETRDLFLAVYAKDVDLSIRLALQMSGASYKRYAPLIREDMERYIEGTRTSGMAFWFIGFIRIFIAHRVPLPHQLLLFGRMQILLDGLFETVLPGTTTLDILGEELGWALRQRILTNLTAMNFAPVVYSLTERLRESPEALTRLIGRYFEHPLDLVAEISRAVQGVMPERA